MTANRPRRTLKFRFILYTMSTVAIFIASIFLWMAIQSRNSILSQIDHQARSLLQQIVTTRAWVADHGGIYIREQPGVEGNPFLPDTEIVDHEGIRYFYRNPAMVTREISQYAERASLYRIRLSSLKPINGANTPLPFEMEALEFFEEQGFEHCRNGISSQGEENGSFVYRCIVPLQVEESCMGCHGDQGYRVGEIRGGLSVIIPMNEARAAIWQHNLRLVIACLAILLLVFGLLYYFLHTMVLAPVSHLQNTANNLIEGQYGARASLQTGDEFQSLGETLNEMTDRLKKSYEGTLKSLMAAVDAKDPYTKGHTERVSHYSSVIASELRLPQNLISEIELGAALHDIGKIGIDDEILKKATSLKGEEAALMAAHICKGAEIIGSADFLNCTLPAVLYHHERPDGKGYPEGLSREDLPLAARIIAVADAYDAMTTDRPYRKALPPSKALAEIIKGIDCQFDREVVEAFKNAFEKGLLRSNSCYRVP